MFLPYVLDQIHLELMMQWTIMHSVVPCKDLCKGWRRRVVDHRFFNGGYDCLVGVVVGFATLIIDDHAMHDDTNTHDQTKNAHRERMTWGSKDLKASFEDSKSSLYILPSALLVCGE